MGVLFAVVEYGCVSVLERTKLIDKHIDEHPAVTQFEKKKFFEKEGRTRMMGEGS